LYDCTQFVFLSGCLFLAAGRVECGKRPEFFSVHASLGQFFRGAVVKVWAESLRFRQLLEDGKCDGTRLTCGKAGLTDVELAEATRRRDPHQALDWFFIRVGGAPFVLEAPKVEAKMHGFSTLRTLAICSAGALSNRAKYEDYASRARERLVIALHEAMFLIASSGGSNSLCINDITHFSRVLCYGFLMRAIASQVDVPFASRRGTLTGNNKSELEPREQA
jgi:hypothetical protein